MLQFKDDEQLTISSRHYMHTLAYKIDQCRTLAAQVLYKWGVVENGDCELFQGAVLHAERIKNDATIAADAVADALAKEFFTGRITERFIDEWEGKAGKLSIDMIRDSVAVTNNFSAIYGAARSVLDAKQFDDDALTTWLVANDKQNAHLIVDNLYKPTMDAMSELRAALIDFPRFEEFIEQSSMRRSAKLQELVDAGSSITLPRIASVIRIGDSGKVSYLRDVLHDRLAKMLSTKFTKETVSEDPSLASMHKIGPLIAAVVDSLREETRADLLAGIKNKITDNGSGELGTFIMSTIIPAITKAFTLVDKRSSVIINVAKVLHEHMQNEFGEQIIDAEDVQFALGN